MLSARRRAKPTKNLSELSSLLAKHTKLPSVLETKDEEADSTFEKVLKLNIGGVPFQIHSETLLKRPKSTLLRRFLFMNKTMRCVVSDFYDKEKDEYFFERSAQIFEPIYRYLVTGVCHRPKEVCVTEFLAELKHWGMQDTQAAFAKCCWPSKDLSEDSGLKQDFKSACLGKIREKLWNLIEEPQSSIAARLCNIFSVLMVILSNFCMILGSLHQFQVRENDKLVPHPSFELFEYVCIGWFTLEYVLKLLVCTQHCAVFFKCMNLVDLVAILPFFLELFLQAIGFGSNQLGDFKSALLCLRILRALRIVRIFKLGKYSSGIQLFSRTIQASMRQLLMLGLVVLTVLVFFSTMIYFIEKDVKGTRYHSIPASFWWCLVTMSCAGYGDVVPTTAVGKLVASGAVISGMMVLVLPITIVADNYMELIDQQEEQQRDLQEMMDKLNEEDWEQTKAASGFAKRKKSIYKHMIKFTKSSY